MNVKRDKERHYTMNKGSIHEGIIIVNIYAPNTGTLQYIRKVLISIKGEIGSNTTVGGFNSPLIPMYRSSKWKINKETEALNDTSGQIELIDIYKTFPWWLR